MDVKVYMSKTNQLLKDDNFYKNIKENVIRK